MDGIPAVYHGKVVAKEHFRAYVYAMDGTKKLMNSWKEFESHLETGLWFDAKYKSIKETQEEPMPKKSSRKARK